MKKFLNGEYLDMTPEEEAIFIASQIAVDLWIEIRAKRGRLLASSDWSQLPDAPCDQEAWAAYRQTLRDIPQTYSDPTTVVWPTDPTDTSLR